MDKKVTFENSKGQKLVGLLAIPNKKNPPIVICLHGLKGDKTYYTFTNKLVGLLFKNGFAVLRFDFHAHGESEGNAIDFTRASCADDLSAAIKFIKAQPVNSSKIGIFGTSMGAVAAVIHGCKECKAIAFYDPFILPLLWRGWFKYYAKEIKEKGYMLMTARKTNRKIKFGKALYNEGRTGDITPLAKKIDKPTLLIYGDHFEKEITSKTTALFKNSKEKIIKDAGHCHLGKEQSEEVATLSLDWFKKYLK